MTNVTQNRPLSPHLTIYKQIPTMVMSIMHRFTGMALYAGTLLVAWSLVAAASGEATFDWVNGIFGSILGRLVLFGYTWALMHHMLGGLRHFVWDMGKGYGPERYTYGWLTLAGGVVLTALLWLFVLI
ncbi:succinate dehydrogenase, cytochrome b556 subunit [uncultured Maritalea sp.]|uniref:succinate dehydrogenase, cytochrome b556 subunit n=1 Tax=uncultured Maritalea sp. TaxID=757249 RepID=UPI0026320EEC|nr:succinate dehydrogenase, cytochrome b556 subunit [uncultured Maritalea sp.]